MTASAHAEAVVQAGTTLARDLRAVDEGGLEAILGLLRHAVVDLGGSAMTGCDALAEGYRTRLADGGRTVHVLGLLEVLTDPDAQHAVSGPAFVARAPYQRFSLDTDPPELTALGRYEARFQTGPDGLRLTRLMVIRDWVRTA